MKSPGLNNLLASEIARRGPLTFARFMELALYHPEFGFYASGRSRIGREGDFYTNVSVGPVFGRVLAGQFQEMWHRLGRPAPFVLVEQGAHSGQFAADVLRTLPGDFPVRYVIIEPSPRLRQQQTETLAPLEKPVQWFASLEEMPEFTGVHFSNELVDALPFHLVRSTGDGWEELGVTMEEGVLEFAPCPPAPAIAAELTRFPSRPAGTLAEVRPAVRDWIHTLSNRMHAGFVLVVDYGFPREVLHAPHRREGTFSCYRDHHRDAHPLEDPGDKDITAHVDFSALADAARQTGFQVEGFADQYHYLVGASETLLRSLEGPPDPAAQKTLRALQTLLHPESMGTQFHYLALSKNVTHGEKLSGFRHSRKSV